jgi:hypothetical protein
MAKVTYWVESCYHASVPYIPKLLRLGPFETPEAARHELERLRRTAAFCDHDMRVVRSLELDQRPVASPKPVELAAMRDAFHQGNSFVGAN